jgi:DNA (cytosine-5)-methyltransferase 1
VTTTADRPWALDVYCCEGAASRGLFRAGYNVAGIDLFKHVNAKGKRVGYSQDRYPFPSVQMDALEALDRLLAGRSLHFVDPFGSGARLRLTDFALGWGSPPCQHASAGTRALRAQGKSEHPALIEPTRERFEAARELTGADWVIENVKGAALRDPVTLCGSMFGLSAIDADGQRLHLERHRMFEATFPLVPPAECDHTYLWAAGVYGGSRRAKVAKGTPLDVAAPLDRHAARFERHGGYVPRSIDVRRKLLGLDEYAHFPGKPMTSAGMNECIPPEYALWVGMAALANAARQENVA